MGIADTFRSIRDRVDRAAADAGRDPRDITIVAVSKTVPAVRVQEAIDAGITLFGENKVQEARDKIPGLRGAFAFHLIGHLQSNKARDAVRLFEVIHTLDKESTARAVDHEAAKIGKRQKVLLQVNASGEDTKSGVSPDGVLPLARAIAVMEHLELLGVMTMAPFTDDEARIRAAFRTAKNVLDEINGALNSSLRELSMGMSSDYVLAIEEGATLVRIGTALFGERSFT